MAARAGALPCPRVASDRQANWQATDAQASFWLPIVQFATTASRAALPGRRTRSATPPLTRRSLARVSAPIGMTAQTSTPVMVVDFRSTDRRVYTACARERNQRRRTDRHLHGPLNAARADRGSAGSYAARGKHMRLRGPLAATGVLGLAVLAVGSIAVLTSINRADALTKTLLPGRSGSILSLPSRPRHLTPRQR